MVPVRGEDPSLHLACGHRHSWTVQDNAMRENYGTTIALGAPLAKPEAAPQDGGLLPVKGAEETPDTASGPPGFEQAIKADQQLPEATDRPGGPENLKDPAKSCPGDWLIRTVKVEAEDYTEWPAGLSTEALLSGLPLASACKSEGRVPGPDYKDGAGLGELSGLAMQQWQMLSEDKPLGCPRCEQPAAPLGGSLGDPRPRPFACLQCGKAFGKKAHLTRHARIHTGERPFACTHCGRRFSQKIHLGSHERVHTGERPFPCDRCPKSFRKKTHLVRHQLTHTGERPHACTLCPRSFVHRRHLLRHQRLHEEEAARVGGPAELGQAAPSYGNGLELGLTGNVPPSGENLATAGVLGQNCRVQGDRAQLRGLVWRGSGGWFHTSGWHKWTASSFSASRRDASPVLASMVRRPLPAASATLLRMDYGLVTCHGHWWDSNFLLLVLWAWLSGVAMLSANQRWYLLMSANQRWYGIFRFSEPVKIIATGSLEPVGTG